MISYKEITTKIVFFIVKTVVTFFGSGLSKLAPGTCGSLATYILIVGLCSLVVKYKLPPILFISFCIIFIFLLGLLFSYYYMRITSKNDDPQEIVIDEVVGQLLSFSLSFVSLLLPNENKNIILLNNSFKITFFIVMPFVLFRFFDITKPSLVGYFDRIKNAFGVMMDDVIAGVFAGLTNSLIIFILIKLFVK